MFSITNSMYVFLCTRDNDEHGCSSTEHGHGIDLDVAREQLSRISNISDNVTKQLVRLLVLRFLYFVRVWFLPSQYRAV